MTHEGGALDAQLIEKAQDGLRLSHERTVEAVTAIRVAMAQEIGRQHTALRREPRDHVAEQERPRRDPVQQDDGIPLPQVGIGELQLKRSEAAQGRAPLESSRW